MSFEDLKWLGVILKFALEAILYIYKLLHVSIDWQDISDLKRQLDDTTGELYIQR